MEELTTKKMLDDKIRNCIEGLGYIEMGSDQHNALVNDIQKLTAAYTELEKMEFQKADSDRKFAEDIREKEVERYYRDELEREKLKEEKKSGWRDAGIRIAGIIIPTGLYFMFLSLGMKLEFLDHGAITSHSVKELFKAIHPKMMA